MLYLTHPTAVGCFSEDAQESDREGEKERERGRREREVREEERVGDKKEKTRGHDE